MFRFAERLMGMNEGVWQRHANPWSVWSRFTVLPLLVLAIWSRVWLGGWALLPIGAALAWTWLNPRVFAPVTRFDGWAQRAVLGERVFLHNRGAVAAHHVVWARVLAALSLPGAVLMGWGLWALAPLATLCGTVLTMLPKVWFCDRMVWLYQDFLADDPARKPGDI